MNRKEVVRKEKELMVHYIEKHRQHDERGKAEVMQEIQKNIEQRKFAHR